MSMNYKKFCYVTKRDKTYAHLAEKMAKVKRDVAESIAKDFAEIKENKNIVRQESLAFEELKAKLAEATSAKLLLRDTPDTTTLRMYAVATKAEKDAQDALLQALYRKGSAHYRISTLKQNITTRLSYLRHKKLEVMTEFHNLRKLQLWKTPCAFSISTKTTAQVQSTSEEDHLGEIPSP